MEVSGIVYVWLVIPDNISIVLKNFKAHSSQFENQHSNFVCYIACILCLVTTCMLAFILTVKSLTSDWYVLNVGISFRNRLPGLLGINCSFYAIMRKLWFSVPQFLPKEGVMKMTCVNICKAVRIIPDIIHVQ